MRGRSACIVGGSVILMAFASACQAAPVAGPTPASSAVAREATLDAGISTALSNAASGFSTAISNAVSGAAGLSGATSGIAAGGNRTCLLEDGKAACWGQNQAGQLGDGTFEDRNSPTAVVAAGNIAALSLGYTHTCALKSGGEIVCWGSGASVQLESGGFAGYQDVAAGASHTCGLTSGGGIKCWGGNNLGGLGDGTTENRSEPADVVGMEGGVTALAAGVDFSCAVQRGGAKCWGSNDTGQLGIGSYAGSLTPEDVVGLNSGVAGIAAGVFHACSWKEEGGVWCWGENLLGNLGDGTNFNSPFPVSVSGLTGGVKAVVVGGSHTCALIGTGGVKCWGNNTHGQLGDGSTADSNTPVDVLGLTRGVLAIAAGGSHTRAMLSGKTVKCWGLNDHGQLGNGTYENSGTPVDVSGLPDG